MVRRICEVKSLVNMGFIATAITDAALQHLVTLPKLAYLFLQDSDKISGKGFRHFRNHAKLEYIGIENVSITDEGLKAIVQIPKLKSLRLINSRVSFTGLLAAADTKIQFYLNGGRLLAVNLPAALRCVKFKFRLNLYNRSSQSKERK